MTIEILKKNRDVIRRLLPRDNNYDEIRLIVAERYNRRISKNTVAVVLAGKEENGDFPIGDKTIEQVLTVAMEMIQDDFPHRENLLAMVSA